MKKNILIIIILSTLLVGCGSYVDTNDSTPPSQPTETLDVAYQSNDNLILDVTEKTKDEKNVNFAFKKDIKVDITQFIIEDENYSIPHGYLGDTCWTGDEKLDKVLMVEIIKTMGRFVTFKDDILITYLSEDEILNLAKPFPTNKWYTTAMYGNHKIRPFYTEFQNYVGVENSLQFIETKEFNSDEVYSNFSMIPERWEVDFNYYYIDTNNNYSYDDKGYYTRLYEDKVQIEMKDGKLIDLNKYIDVSSTTDWYFPLSYNSNVVGMARWTDDIELNKALLSFLLNKYSHDRVFKRDYITELINEEDAVEIIKKYDNWGFPEGMSY